MDRQTIAGAPTHTNAHGLTLRHTRKGYRNVPTSHVISPLQHSVNVQLELCAVIHPGRVMPLVVVHLQSHQTSQLAHITVYHVISHTWSMSITKHNGCFTTICRIFWLNKISNMELEKTSPAVMEVKLRWFSWLDHVLRWLGHVLRMHTDSIPQTVSPKLPWCGHHPEEENQDDQRQRRGRQ